MKWCQTIKINYLDILRDFPKSLRKVHSLIFDYFLYFFLNLVSRQISEIKQKRRQNLLGVSKKNEEGQNQIWNQDNVCFFVFPNETSRYGRKDRQTYRQWTRQKDKEKKEKRKTKRERKREVQTERWPTQDNGIFHTIWMKKREKSWKTSTPIIIKFQNQIEKS